MTVGYLIVGIILTMGACSIILAVSIQDRYASLSAAKTPTPTADLQPATPSPSPEHMNGWTFRVALESFLKNCQQILPLSTLLTVTYKDGSTRVFSFGTQYLPVLEVYRALTTGGSITLSQEKSSEEYSPMGVAVSLPSLGLLPEGTKIYPEKTTQTSRYYAAVIRHREAMRAQSNPSPEVGSSPPSTRN